MEKRFYLGVGILAVILVLGLIAAWGMERISGTAVDLLEQAAEEILSGDTEKGAQLAQKAKQVWQKGWRTMALAADHNPMDEIDGLFAQMEFLAKMGNRTELGAYCARVAELVEAVADVHKLSWWNVL